MRLTLFFIITMFLFSCYQDNLMLDATDGGLEKNTRLNELWICYHPNTKFHNEVCVEDYFPDGCYVKGEKSRFCWKLTSSDCLEESIEEQWPNHCHRLKK